MRKGLLLLLSAFVLWACSKEAVETTAPRGPETKVDLGIKYPDSLSCNDKEQTLQFSLSLVNSNMAWQIKPVGNVWRFVSIAEADRSGKGSKIVSIHVPRNSGNTRIDSLAIWCELAPGYLVPFPPARIIQAGILPFTMSPVNTERADIPYLWNGEYKDYTIGGIDGPIVLTGANRNVKFSDLSVRSGVESYFTISTVSGKPNVVRLTKRSDMGELGPFDLQFERIVDGSKSAVSKISASRPLVIAESSSESKPIYCPQWGQALLHFSGSDFENLEVEWSDFSILPVSGDPNALYLRNNTWDKPLKKVRLWKKLYGGYADIWITTVRTDPYIDITPGNESTARLWNDTTKGYVIDPVNGSGITLNIKTNATSDIGVSLTPWSSSSTDWSLMDFMFRTVTDDGGFGQGFTYRTSSSPNVDYRMTSKNGSIPKTTTSISFMIPVPHQIYYPYYQRSATMTFSIAGCTETVSFSQKRNP